jgi:DNA-binding LacI/PurR family transcriptional regulator
MKPFRALSTSDQLFQHLKEEILSGRLKDTMPGIQHLVKSLGVNSLATANALQQLERDGLIISQGRRRKRLITPIQQAANSSMRIGFLHYDAQNELRHDSLLVRQALIDAGHTPIMAPKTMHDLSMSTERIKRIVESIEVDAWIIYAGSQETLQWFSEYKVPSFAIYGRLNSANIPGMGIRKLHIDEMLVDRLVELGHKRIVLIVREERRKPHCGRAEKIFLEHLEAHDIQTGPYNIPDWEETPAGLTQCLDKLLRHTPPTAILVCDPVLFHAVQVHLAHRGYKAPGDISLYCDDYTETFDWTTPSVAHLRWDYRPIIRRVLQWTENLSMGREDNKRSFTKAKFVDGDTIGIAPK